MGVMGQMGQEIVGHEADTAGCAGMIMLNARTRKEFREKLDVLLGELEGFEIHATVILHKDGATKEDNDRLTRALDKWQEL